MHMVLWEEHRYVTVISPKITAACVFFPPSRENMEKYSITRGREHSCSIFRALLKKYRDFSISHAGEAEVASSEHQQLLSSERKSNHTT